MDKTLFEISKMDCPSEENLIRVKLDPIQEIKNLEFDIPRRKLTVFHEGNIHEIEQAIQALNLGGKKLNSEQTNQTVFIQNTLQRKLLWTVLAINFGFFLIEIVFGIISNSMGLVADSLDMLADAFVYGISLLAIGSTLSRKKRVASIAGIFQLILASLGFLEVIRRFLGFEAIPDFSTMIIVSTLALIANGFCLFLLQKSSEREEAHIKASLIFTSNDVIINLGVILAGFLVYWLNSGIPDLVIGSVVFILVLRGAIRILKLGR